MDYIIGVIVLILIFIIWGYFFKKRYFKEIDRLESWKISITHRPVLEELSKVKQLNMTGETEEMFENWRIEWDAIITDHMPEVEELLFDAEEFVDKYRFSRSKEVQRKITVKLNEIEEMIKKILYELNELVGSEEKNRLEIEDIKESYRQLKKSLLAHRHNYGKAADKLENSLDEVVQILQKYEEETVNGNYLNARELVLSIKEKLAVLSVKMEMLPKLLVDSQSELHSQLHELKDGYEEMSEQGYLLSHIQFEQEISRLEEELELYKTQLENAETEAVEKGIKDMRESIEVLYDLLEKEVLSKQYILKNDEVLRKTISDLEYENDKLKVETIHVQHTYHLTENELDAQRKMEKQIAQISKRHQLLVLKMEDNVMASSLISEEMQGLAVQLKELQENQKDFTVKLQALRKDEMDARDSLAELKRKMVDTGRLIAKSNIPGLPEEYKVVLQDAKECMDDVQGKLEEKPLEMAAVYIYLEKAVQQVNRVHEKANELIEHMYLAEKVIQFGNRYRSSHDMVAESLREAEAKFRSYEYQAALETAATAIEKVDPGSLQKIGANIEEVLS
ncbi:septation ring formation regulator EzrA [Peribacillus simplex]|uniref:Septation ring formation regulator EzrA n=1 Tax=Peribacillus simplex TaxID=1478 RepID=A0A9W4PE05_9BACI|nr:septation ring formation regulator EzrA [Peribacillus simplex]MDR4925198.1 septation ring formation regulator EzrA [Peribacillus simplex]WHX90116.1 septation ring formation regulator EzrA [Peribacillus simplex]CAH0209769.1 Septation ring formation regulator EzrA [Peribacillus simplex]